MTKQTTLSLERKYKLYEDSVQNPLSDVDFINDKYKQLRGRMPLSLREDFSGTGLFAYQWVKQSAKHKAWAIDLRREPQEYGKKHHYGKLQEQEKERMVYICGNVLDEHSFKTDVVIAFNFSYFIFKERRKLLNYANAVLQGLSKDGAFIIDIFGGTECFQELEEETEFDNHSYFWDCNKYNPITQEVLYHIHFNDKKKNILYKEVFSYDWRHWGVREVEEILQDAGFSDVRIYWEGEGEDGEGDGEFYESREEENCDSWVAYIVGLK